VLADLVGAAVGVDGALMRLCCSDAREPWILDRAYGIARGRHRVGWTVGLSSATHEAGGSVHRTVAGAKPLRPRIRASPRRAVRCT